MSVELLNNLSIASYIVAGVLLLVAVALFFLFDVPKLYGDISGRTAKKAIEAIRQQNADEGNKAYKPSSVNVERGKLTDKITKSGRLESATAGLPVSVGTEKFATSMLAPQANETTLLTETLNQPAGETTLLTQETPVEEETVVTDVEFRMDVEMSFTGSAELIE